MASCGRWLVTARPGRPGKSPARHYDLAARSSLHGSKPAEASATAGAGDGSAAPRPKTATVERREASVPRHGTQGASQAPGVPRHKRVHARLVTRRGHAPRVPRTHPNVSRRSAAVAAKLMNLLDNYRRWAAIPGFFPACKTGVVMRLKTPTRHAADAEQLQQHLDPLAVGRAHAKIHVEHGATAWPSAEAPI